jgi:hypothetical protein
MADMYIDWTSFCVGLVIGFVCCCSVCNLIFPIKKD